MNKTDKYKSYKIEEFVWDDEFRKWVLDADNADAIFWEDWLLKNPEKNTIVAQAREVLLALQLENQQLSYKQRQSIISNTMAAIDTPVLNAGSTFTVHRQEKKGWKFYSRYVASIAAALLIVVAAIWLFHKNTSGQDIYSYASLVKKSETVLTETTNYSSVPLFVRLSDGSRVTLEKGAKISYPPVFANVAKREVYLSGEAFFEVTKNPIKPFIVYSKGLITKVLGTSFLIKADERDKSVSVEVRTGKVWINKMMGANPEKGSEINGVVLVPNQQVVFNKDADNLQVSIVDNPQPVIESENKLQSMEFKDEKVTKVLMKLSKLYGVEIVYDTTVLSKYPITANFTDETLFERLKKVIFSYCAITDKTLLAIVEISCAFY